MNEEIDNLILAGKLQKAVDKLKDYYRDGKISKEAYMQEVKSPFFSCLDTRLPRIKLKAEPIYRTGLDSLPDRSFLIDRFDMERQGLVCICGQSEAGKSIFTSYLALCVKNNIPLFGSFGISDPKRNKKVLHIDFELGETQTKRRYERLANFVLPTLTDAKNEKNEKNEMVFRLKLDHKIDRTDIPKNEWIDQLEEVMSGYDLVIIDSLRQATSTDENSSQISVVMEILKGLAEKINGVIVVIHHKSTKGSSQNKGKDQGRGSSAIYAGFDIVIDLDRDEDSGVITLKCQKNRDFIRFKSIQYKLQDGEIRHNGQRCSQSLELILIDGEVRKETREMAVLKLVKTGNPATKRAYLYAQTGKGDREKFAQLLSDMVQQNLIEKTMIGKADAYSIGTNAEQYLCENKNEEV